MLCKKLLVNYCIFYTKITVSLNKMLKVIELYDKINNKKVKIGKFLIFNISNENWNKKLISGIIDKYKSNIHLYNLNILSFPFLFVKIKREAMNEER